MYANGVTLVLTDMCILVTHILNAVHHWNRTNQPSHLQSKSFVDNRLHTAGCTVISHRRRLCPHPTVRYFGSYVMTLPTCHCTAAWNYRPLNARRRSLPKLSSQWTKLISACGTLNGDSIARDQWDLCFGMSTCVTPLFMEPQGLHDELMISSWPL